jgi:hypothetical protein
MYVCVCVYRIYMCVRARARERERERVSEQESVPPSGLYLAAAIRHSEFSQGYYNRTFFLGDKIVDDHTCTCRFEL